MKYMFENGMYIEGFQNSTIEKYVNKTNFSEFQKKYYFKK